MDKAILLIYGVTWLTGVTLPFLVLCTYRACARLRLILRASGKFSSQSSVFRGIPLEYDTETLQTISV